MARRRHAPARRAARSPRSSRPPGRGVRVDTFGYVGYATSPRFDSLLAKVIVHRRSPTSPPRSAGPTARCASSASRASPTNSRSSRALLATPTSSPTASTRASSRSTSPSCRRRRRRRPRRYFDGARRAAPGPASPRRGRRRGVDTDDPLAVLAHGKSGRRRGRRRRPGASDAGRDGGARRHGAVVRADAGHDRQRRRRATATPSAPAQPLLVMEAMKMEHVVAADAQRHRARSSRSRRATPSSRATPLVFVERGATSSARPAPRRTRSISTASAPTSPRCSSATRSASTRRGPTRSRGGARPASAPRARTSTTSCDPGTLRRVRRRS